VAEVSTDTIVLSTPQCLSGVMHLRILIASRIASKAQGFDQQRKNHHELS
jgi:hypothetical protein